MHSRCRLRHRNWPKEQTTPKAALQLPAAPARSWPTPGAAPPSRQSSCCAWRRRPPARWSCG
eukprot:1075620-Alexandrium_andersonii.AAC.1